MTAPTPLAPTLLLPTLLIVAKAPVPGLAKTRIGRTVGDVAAAELAAAALLDTLATAALVGWPVVVAVTGDLARAARTEEIAVALAATHVVDQRGESLGERLSHAHTDAEGGNGVVQVGMDTPQVTVDDFIAAGQVVSGGNRVIGPAEDGGWWLLGLPDPSEARVLADVPMSRDDTCTLTEDALGGHFTQLRLLRDMDKWGDAVAISRGIPDSHLAKVVHDIGARV